MKQTLKKYKVKHKPINKSKKNINKPRYISEYESEYEPEYEPIYTIIEPTNPEWQILNFAGLRSRLSRYDLQECNQFKCMNRTPTFVWLNYDEHSMHHLKRKYYRTRIYLQNSLTNIDSIDDKDKLHLDMETHFPDIYKHHMTNSQLLKQSWNPYSQKNLNGSVYIARPVNILKEQRKIGEQDKGYGGKDIIIIHDKKSLQNAKLLLDKYENVLISDYIMNPLLFQHRKFHLRVWFLASIINSTFSAYMLDFARILTAKLPYQQSNWNNPDIHDTHLKSSDRDWFFPDDFTNSNITTPETNPETNPGKNQSEMIPDIINQNRVILTAVAKLLSETVELYDNVKNGFNVFGVDLMITSDSRGNAKVVLLECNSEGTYKTKESGTHKKLENILFTWIDKVILAPLFNKDKKSIKTDGKTDKITISDGKYKYHSYKLFSKIIRNNPK